MTELDNRSTVWPLTLVILFAAAVNWPCLYWGLQFGHDHNLHITYLHFFDPQLRAGELYPHWISGLNFGAGSPIFFVQYPLPYYAAAGLRWVFHISSSPVGYAHSLGLFIFFTGILSAAFTWLWCRSITNSLAAVFASIACLTMPYLYGCDIYYRAAIGEYSALAWVPLALFCVTRANVNPTRAVAGIAFAFAMIVFSHLFTAVLFAPFLILYAIACADRVKAWANALFVGLGLLLGLGLSAVYFLPMNSNRPFFSMANLIRFGSGNFSYATHLFPLDSLLLSASTLRLRFVSLFSAGLGCALVGMLIVRRHRFASPTSKILATAAVVCVLVTCAPPLLHLVGSAPHSAVANADVTDVRNRIFLVTFLTLDLALLAFVYLQNRLERLPQFLFASSLIFFILTTQWSAPIWRHLPFLWNIQFPWRFTGLLSIFTVELIAFAVRDLWNSAHHRPLLISCAGLWLAVVVAGNISLDMDKNFKQSFFTEFRARVEMPFFAYAHISRAPTAAELGPNDDLVGGVSFLSGSGTATLDTITARHLRLAVNCLRPCTLLLKLVYYPLWRAYETPGGSISLEPSSRAGLTEISLTTGPREVYLELPFSHSELYGACLSICSLVVILILYCFPSRIGDFALRCFHANELNAAESGDGQSALHELHANNSGSAKCTQ